MSKEKPEHLDILGQPVDEGNYVAVSYHNMLRICQIRKLTPKMMRVVPIGGQYYKSDGFQVYSTQTILLSGPDALAYILTYAGA